MPTPYSPAAGRANAQERALALKKSMGNLDQDSGAVAGLRIATARAAVHQILQDLNALENDVVGLAAVNMATKPMPQPSCSFCGS